jgi:aminoglycoside phosphotransferase (APT) family kinase protein
LISKTAHSVEREFMVLSRLSKTNIPVPKVFSLCVDSSILGTPFYVMSYIEGRIFSNVTLLTVPILERRDYYFSIIDTLVDLHNVDVKEVGLENYGPSEGVGFYHRQLSRLYQVSKKQAMTKNSNGENVGVLYKLEEMMKWLIENAVADKPRKTIMHGDYKTDNIVKYVLMKDI